jgi:DNA-directed RNA polymerase subunit RPC12/RpoP
MQDTPSPMSPDVPTAPATSPALGERVELVPRCTIPLQPGESVHQVLPGANPGTVRTTLVTPIINMWEPMMQTSMVLLGLLALLALWRSVRRFHRIAQTPQLSSARYCSKCNHEFPRRLKGEPAQCPECGASLAKARALVAGRSVWKRRTRPILVGVLGLGALFMLGVVALASRVFSGYVPMPTAMVRRLEASPLLASIPKAWRDSATTTVVVDMHAGRIVERSVELLGSSDGRLLGTMRGGVRVVDDYSGRVRLTRPGEQNPFATLRTYSFLPPKSVLGSALDIAPDDSAIWLVVIQYEKRAVQVWRCPLPRGTPAMELEIPFAKDQYLPKLMGEIVGYIDAEGSVVLGLMSMDYNTPPNILRTVTIFGRDAAVLARIDLGSMKATLAALTSTSLELIEESRSTLESRRLILASDLPAPAFPLHTLPAIAIAVPTTPDKRFGMIWTDIHPAEALVVGEDHGAGGISQSATIYAPAPAPARPAPADAAP